MAIVFKDVFAKQFKKMDKIKLHVIDVSTVTMQKIYMILINLANRVI